MSVTNLAERVRPGIDSIEPYSPGLTDDELKKRYGLRKVIKLNANENALGPSPLALKAIEDEMTMLHHYPDGSSDLLRTAIADFHGVDKSRVLAGNGSDEIIKLISETFLEPIDQVVVPRPTFSQYAFGAAVMRATPVYVPLRPDFGYDVEAIAAAVTPATKLIYLCSPNNPTGTVLTGSEVQWLLDQVPKSVVLVLDLAYNDYSGRGDRVMETESLLSDERVVFLHTFSKMYGLAGLRVGYAIAHPNLLQYVHRVREPFNVNRVAQRAAAAALGDIDHVSRSKALVMSSKALYLDFANRFGLFAPEPEGNFILLKTGEAKGTTAAMAEQGVMVRAGFGLTDFIRVTYGTEEENVECIRVLSELLRGRSAAAR